MDTNQNHIGVSPLRRMLVFSWSNPDIVGMLENFLDYVERRYGFLACIITDHPSGKFMFVKQGRRAFTIEELIRCCRHLPVPHILPEDLEELGRYDRVVNWSAYDPAEVFKAYAFFFDFLRPAAVFTWNGVALLQKTPVFIARKNNIPCFFMERGLLPQTLVVDPEGVNYGSHIAGIKWDHIDRPELNEEVIRDLSAYCTTITARGKSVVESGRRVSAEHIRATMGISDDASVILFPLQIEKDSNILYYSPYYKKMSKALMDIEQAIAAMDNTHLIVKPHPEDSDKHTELQTLCSPRTHIVSEFDLQSLLETSSAVVTINSTVGLEALICHKPVVVLGKAVYSHKGFTFDLDEPSSLPDLIKAALAPHDFSLEAFYGFLSYLVQYGLFDLTGSAPWQSCQKIGAALDEAVRSAAGLEEDQQSGSVFLDAIKTNEQLIELIAAQNTAGNQKIECLLYRYQPEVEQALACKQNHNFSLVTFTGPQVLLRLPKLILRRPDCAITQCPASMKDRLLWSLIPAKVKLQY